MPVIFRFFGLKFFFYANDHEPIHVHITRGGSEAVYLVEDEISLRNNYGFKKNELKLIESIIEENKDIIIEEWENFFKL